MRWACEPSHRPAGGAPAEARGRIDKRRAILEAASRVFTRDGYGRSCVREIAAEADVAKPTVYNHVHDKDPSSRRP
ncbi:TetR/AcrR family transcriptional regulator [Nocardiopsis halophila]|uniref:TetR/AcrR family transcriptional regulator n=1 Tax=Nocardiopsis halophila TaxID=141692 RepID=UPI000344D25C|nr:helix-turn-helix domain-containing protein [Nocardiopsis halophila]